MMRNCEWKLAGAVAASALAFWSSAMPAGAATPASFDPAHPFAGLTAADQWLARFRTGKPETTPRDPWGNLTTSALVDKATGGYWVGQPGMTPAKIANLPQPDARGARASQEIGGTGVQIRSPYPYKSAQEHFDAWLAAANGGTKKTRDMLPDWSGEWSGGAQGVIHGEARITDVMSAVAPSYRDRYRQYLRAEWEGHTWWGYAFCLPHGYPQTLNGNGATYHIMADQNLVKIHNGSRGSNEFLNIYTDGRGFAPEGKLPPQWYGESKGFWDGDELVAYTKNVKAWLMAPGLPETSGKLETVMRVKRLGDKILMDVTIYDPEAFAFPWHDVVIYNKVKDWLAQPQTYLSCAYTNNVYLAEDGSVNERLPGDPGFRDPADPRPWATAFQTWAQNHPDLAAKWDAAFNNDEAAAAR